MGMEDRDWYRERKIDWDRGGLKGKNAKKQGFPKHTLVDPRSYPCDGCRIPFETPGTGSSGLIISLAHRRKGLKRRTRAKTSLARMIAAALLRLRE